MKLILLGTGGYFPTGRRQTACLMLPEIGIVLDAGTGMFRLGKHLATDRLDIFLSHAHLDHVAGLTYLIAVLPPDVQRRTIVHGDSAKLAAVREHLFADAIFPVPPAFEFKTLGQSFAMPGGGTLTHFPLMHPGGALGFRLDWPDRSMAYVTDTTATPGAAYIEQIRGVDLLVHESYFPADVNDGPAQTGHSSLGAAATLAAEAGVQRLVLTHIDPLVESDATFDMAAAGKTFANIELGHDEMVVEF
jgi:ribonuclease BN (tRNA processing enzyme)